MGHEMFHLPRPLGMASDSKYLTEFHCFLRSNLIEVFCATKEDMNGKVLILLRNRALQDAYQFVFDLNGVSRILTSSKTMLIFSLFIP